jgi:aminoglycoside phosphotransferase (APT) family kinase protein
VIILYRIKGLEDYIKNQDYRKALGLPEEAVEEYELLAQGEYNINYLFRHPLSGQKLILRVNCGSQMHLEHQIEYEFHALKLIEGSNRTPKVYYVDGSLEKLNHGVLVMEYLPGQSLDYRKDLVFAAQCLADIHSIPISKNCGLIEPGEPLTAILKECEQMVKVYMDAPFANEKTKNRIRKMLDAGWKRAKAVQTKSVYQCCINTELNSTNFLINGEEKGNYLIDWEKPLYGDPAQDLGHFLAPTTTFWKTDVILKPEEITAFLAEYEKAVAGRFPVNGLKKRVNVFIPITCLRGITWCAMAWVEYQQPDKLIFNESTFHKLTAYLSDEFLGEIENEYYR